MEPRFEQFIRERQYLSNVSPATLEWYKHSFKWLPTETPTKEELQEAVMRMREKGLKATGCNSAIRAINAYLKWNGTPHRVLYLKEEQRVLPTFSLPHIKKLLSYRPKLSNLYQRRLPLLILVLLDTGCWIDEVGKTWPLTRMVGGTTRKVNDEENYCSFAYSPLACFRMGMSGSASFQRVRKS